MVEVIERTSALVMLRPGRAAQWGALGLVEPAMGRFVEVGGLLVARVAPHQVLAMREGVGCLMRELAGLGAGVGVIDLSDSRVAVRLPGARLAHLVPLDLRGFAPGRCAATMMGHLAVLLLRHKADDYELQCGRSFGGSFLRGLALAA